MDKREEHYTLGRSVIPKRYELAFEPDMERFVYKASAKIDAEAEKTVRSIKLNAGELEIDTAYVESSTGREKAEILRDMGKSILELRLGKPVSGRIRIEIEFTGIHNDKLYGFYRSRYDGPKGSGYLLTTQFEPANARNAFPCFDEPEFKAVFDVSMIVPEGMSCISNMPARSVKKSENGKKVVSFMPTPKMSTYLLYLGVGDFVRNTSRYRNIEIGLVTTPGREKYSKLALEYAVKFLSYYEKYFGIKFPLPKMDLIAIPDFAAGAMENWGAITFRETALLGDVNSAIATKQRIAEVIAHEFVHQWFGDLVTMKWWNDLWLNESFANFMSYKALDAVFPEWEMMNRYVAEVVGAAFAVDQLKATHPISVKVDTPEEIDQIFDDISYNKGGAVLNMLENFVGKSNFRKGLNAYLRKHAYSNADKYDLWNAIGRASVKEGKGRYLPMVAKSWIDNEGYPGIVVEKRGGRLALRQKRFMLMDSRDENTKWLIPVDIGYLDGKGRESFLMRGGALSVNVEKGKKPKLNFGQSGFYRVFYNQDMLESIGEMIKENEVKGLDAWGVENDLYAYMKKNIVTLGEYLDFIEKYCFAAKYPMNLGILSHLRGLYTLFYEKEFTESERLERIFREYSMDIIKQVGWKKNPEESPTTALMRSSAILGSGLTGEHMTVNKSNKLFDRSLKGISIDPDIRSAVYGIVAWSGNGDIYRNLREHYEKEEAPEEKIRFLAALGMFRDEKLLRAAMDYSLTDKVRYQDSFFIPAYVSSNPLGRKVIWKWTRENWKEIRGRFKSGTHMLGRYVENLSLIGDPSEVVEIRRFFGKKENMRADIRNSVDKTMEIIEINRRFMKRSMESKKEA